MPVSYHRVTPLFSTALVADYFRCCTSFLIFPLYNYFFTNFATIEFIKQIIQAIIQVRDVNLTKIASAIDLGIKQESVYRKLQRFFSSFSFSQYLFAKLMVDFFDLDNECWILAMDRTNWQSGSFNINILMLSICYKGTAIPIMWSILDKKGASNFAERTALLSRFIDIYGAAKIRSLLADREFIGSEWIKWLDEHKINFCIRIREDITIGHYGKDLLTANHFLKNLKPGESCTLIGKRTLGRGNSSTKVQISAAKNLEGELIIVATNNCDHGGIEIYRKRWEIETLFGFLKTRGFNFENTHMRDPKKINILIALLSISFAVCYKTGVIRSESIDKKIKVKNNGVKRVSVFRLGLNYLQGIFFSDGNFLKKFLLLFRHFSSIFLNCLKKNSYNNLFVVY